MDKKIFLKESADKIEQAIVDAWQGNNISVKSPLDSESVINLIPKIKKELRSTSNNAERIGAGNFSTTDLWKEITSKSSDIPKTDIVLANNNISVKYGPAQLMSAGKTEALATFLAAANISGLTQQSIQKTQQMFNQFTKGLTVGNYSSGQIAKMSPEEAKKVGNEAAKIIIDNAKIFHKEFADHMNQLFSSNEKFKIEFIKEAMTGNEKFSDKKAVAEYVLSIKKDGVNFELKRSDDQSYLKKLLGKTSLSIAFKSASKKIKGQGKVGYNFYDSFRIGLDESKNLRENINRLIFIEGSKTLNEGWMQDIYSNVVDKIKQGLAKIGQWLANLPNLIKNILQWIKGKLNNLLDFFGIEPEIRFNNTIDFFTSGKSISEKNKMNEKQLREIIRREIKSIKEASPAKKGPRWATKNFDEKEFYNFWADAKHIHDDWGDFMMLCNKGKFKDAEFALKVGLDSLIDMKGVIDKMIKAAQAELKEKNFYNN